MSLMCASSAEKGTKLPTANLMCVCVLAVLGEICSPSSPVQLNVSWYLRNSHCYHEVFDLDVRHFTEFFSSHLQPKFPRPRL